jgi:membrane-associated phospholipid phosphatase
MRKIRNWISTHSYCLVLLYFFIYLAVFTLEENFLRPVVTIHCPIDDLIPFNSYFVIPYFAWFLLIPAVLGYFMFTSKDEFLDLCFMLFTGMSLCLLIYAIIPNGLSLRQMVTGHDICSRIVVLLRKIDTATNVCPSIHVYATLGIMMSVLRSPRFAEKKLLKAFIVFLSIMICLSTMFLKQHSFVDVCCGTILSLVMYHLTYHCDWRHIFVKTRIGEKILQ